LLAERRSAVDLRTVLVTFGLVFFAELGDKTQMATMMLAAKNRSPLAVFLGAATALSLTALLAVVFGEAIIKVIPQRYLQALAGVAFILIGVLLVSGKV